MASTYPEANLLIIPILRLDQILFPFNVLFLSYIIDLQHPEVLPAELFFLLIAIS